MRKRVIVVGDVVHVVHRPSVRHFGAVPVGIVEEIGAFNGVPPLEERITRTHTYKKAYCVRHQFGEAWYERGELTVCMCRSAHTHLQEGA